MKYIKNFFIFLFCILLASYSIIQIPSVKQFAVKKSIEYVNSKADFKISYEKFSYQDLKNISFSGIAIKNKNDDEELLKLQELQVSLNLFNLIFKRELNFENLNFADLVLLIDKNKNIFLNSNTEQIDLNFLNFFTIRIENINFTNCSLVFDNDDFKEDKEKFFDVNHFCVKKINSQLQNIILSQEGISGSVKKFSASCNKILVNDFNFDVEYRDEGIKLKKIFLNSNHGKFTGDFSANNIGSQENFNYILDLQNLTIDSKKIPQLKNFDKEISFKGEVKGNLRDCFFHKCCCSYKKNSVSFSGFVKNFKDKEKLQYEINKISGDFNFVSLKGIISEKIIKMLPFVDGKFDGSIKGQAQEGKILFNLQSGTGKINSNLDFDNIFSQDPRFEGEINLQKVSFKNFDLTDINSTHKIKFSQEEKKLENKISGLNYNDVSVKNIEFTIQGDKKNYFGFLKINDQDFKTVLNFKNYDNTIYCLGNCNLQNLNNFFKSPKRIDIKNDINIKIKTDTNDIVTIFNNNFFKFGNANFSLKFLKTDFIHEKKFFKINLFSDFLDIKIYDIPEKIKDVKNIFLRFCENLYNWSENKELKISKDPNFKIPFYINIKNDNLFSLINQDINCGNTNIYGEFLNIEGKKILNFNIDKIKNIKIGDKNLTNTDFNFSIGLNEKKKLPTIGLLCEIDKVELPDFYIDNIICKIESQNEKINTNLSLQNNIFKFACNLKAFFKDEKIIFDLRDENSSCSLNSWKLCNDGCVKIASKNISVENLSFEKNQMNFIFDYNLDLNSTGWKNKFLLQIKNVKLENWKKYITNEIKGILNGKIKKNNTSFFDIYFDIDDLRISDNNFGNVNLKTQYNIEKKIYDYSLFIKKEDKISLDVNGLFNSENKKINAKCFFNNFDLKIFESFSDPVCDKLSGFINGALSVFGTFEKPKFWGDLDFVDGNVLFSHIKSEFKANGHFKGDIDGLHTNLELKDDKEGSATFDGKINIKFHKMPIMDLNGKVKNIHILNTTEEDNPVFYGNLFCSGDVNFFGPLNFLTISCNVQNEKNSDLFLNFEKGTENDYSFIHFVENKKENILTKKTTNKHTYNGIKLALNTTLDKNLQVFAKIPFSSIEIQGNGNLNIVTTFEDDLDIKGNFYVEKGTYLFSLKNFVNKKFQIQDGGTLNFLGNVDQTTLDIVATENITLNNSQNENYVILKIITNGLLKNPDIKYDIDISKSSDIDPEIKNKIRTNEDMRNNYFLNLLLFKNFEINSSGISSNILNIFDKMTYSNSEKKNKFQLSITNDKLLLDNSSDLDISYKFSDKFEISKKQKISTKKLKFKDLSENLEIQYSIDNNLKMYTDISKDKALKIGIKIFN